MFYEELQSKPQSSEFTQASQYADLKAVPTAPEVSAEPTHEELLASIEAQKQELPSGSKAELQERLQFYQGHLTEAIADRDKLANSADMDPGTQISQLELAKFNIDHIHQQLDKTQARIDELEEDESRAA